MENKSFSCNQCGTGFTRSNDLRDHDNSVHKGLRYRCPSCIKIFVKPKKIREHHQAKHLDDNICGYCGAADLFSDDHIQKCLLVKAEIGEKLEEINSKINNICEDPIIPELLSYPENIHNEVKTYWNLIRTCKNVSDLLDHSYNYRWTSGDFLAMLTDIFHTEKEAFRINGAFGSILKNRETGATRYWYPCENNFNLLDKPVLIKNGQDLKELVEKLENIDVEEKFTRNDTKTALIAITNVEFYVTPQKNFVAGCKDFLLPHSTTHSHNLFGMTQDTNRNKFKDNLCFFRCLAQCKIGDFENRDFVFMSFVKYCNKKGIQAIVSSFYGVPFTDIEMLEELFEVDIQIYSIDQKENKAVCYKSSVRKYKDLLNLDLSITNTGQAHYCFIVDLDQYAKRYQCLMCSRLFYKLKKLNEHLSGHCNKGETRHKFPGGVFQVKKSVFEQLEEFGIDVPLEKRFCPYFAVYDFEALLLKKEIKTSDKLKFTAEHQPVSCAVSTNVPRFEPVCFVDENPDKLVEALFEHLEKISSVQNQILSSQFEPVFQELETQKISAINFIEQQKALGKETCKEKGYLNFLEKVKQRLINYCSQLTCLGFNSGKYDINLIKRNLFPKLVHKARNNSEVAWPKAILRNGTYLCLSTNTLKFLDISLYVAPGFSLNSFMKAYKASLSKANFPYEYIDSFSKLFETKLPEPEAFYSSLREECISMEEYKQCQEYWKMYDMKNLRDFLVFYNLRDVVPFLEACTTMLSLYWARFGIDIFREAMSLPGVTERYLFKSIPNTRFSLFSENTKEIYYSLKSSMRGGLSMVMSRLAIKDETYIRNNVQKPVKTIIGLDFNALYLWAQSQDTPTGYFDFWTFIEKKTKFQKLKRSKPISVEWLEYESLKTGKYIQHQGNNKERVLGPRRLPVDGYCDETQTVYEFYGCYWHCHECLAGMQNIEKDCVEAQNWIKEKEAYIKDLGFKLVTIWECEWHKVRKHFLRTTRKFQDLYWVPESEMRKAILDGSVFGFAKVDIYTPDELKCEYADFPPIIKHAQVGRKDIGDFMEKYAEKTGQLKKPRNNLISSYFGEKIVMSTEMIKFLVSHGLDLKKIYEVYQYDREQPFEAFRDKVTKHRQEGDQDPSLAMIADTFKLLGNTGYGKTLTNKESHEDVIYADYEKAAECSLSPFMKKIKHITDNCYEVHMRKKEVVLDLPIVIGLSVYNWAKIRMLEFFYDVLQKYFDKSDYQCLQTDTDSIYLALSADNLLDLVKPELKQEFVNNVYPKWFVTSKDTKRTPGLLKEEYRGTAMCCLAAKTYIAIDDITGEKKVSSKGLMKKVNKLTFEDYKQVLITQKATGGKNIGFRMNPDNKIWTYLQEKQGLPYLYVKRKVLPDGISTEPLDI